MAVALIAVQDGEAQKVSAKRHFYIGLSSDSKPTVASHSGLPEPTPGSEFYEYDTQVGYITYDGTNWVVFPLLSGGGGGAGTARFFVSSAATTITITAAALADVAGEYVGQMVVPLQGAMAGEGRYITAYNGTNQLTVSPAWASDPDADGNIEFAVVSGALGYVAKTGESTAALAAVAYTRQAGVTQIKQVAVTGASNQSPLTLVTVTTQSCTLKRIIVRSVAAPHANFTSLAITGGAAGVVSFLSASDGVAANLSDIDKQIKWEGSVELPATSTIIMTFVGAGAGAISFLVTFEYCANVSAGYLV